jgi:hypothetical protein
MTAASSFVLILLAACAGNSAPRAAPAITWSAPIEIASGGGQRGPWQQNESNYDYVDDPSVALEPGGAAAVVWVDQRRKDVLFQVYERDGRPRLARPVNVSRTAAVFSWLPRIVVQSSDVFVLWQEIVFSGGTHGGDICFARSLDGGARFEEPVNLSRSIAGDGKGRLDKERWHNGSLDLAIGTGGVLHAAWTSYEGELWLVRSEDRGASFSEPLRVGATGEVARAPALAVTDDALYLAWTLGEDAGADVRIARSTDGGRTFGSPVIVATTKTYSDAPKLAVDRNGTVHVVHAESTGGPFDRSSIQYTRSRDGAQTFEPPRELSRLDAIESATFPSLSLDEQGHVYVLWELQPDADEPPRGLAIAYSLDGGQTFTTPATVEGSLDPGGGDNGSHQGRLMRKLAVAKGGSIAVVNSALRPGKHSRVWLVRGQRR